MQYCNDTLNLQPVKPTKEKTWSWPSGASGHNKPLATKKKHNSDSKGSILRFMTVTNKCIQNLKSKLPRTDHVTKLLTIALRSLSMESKKTFGGVIRKEIGGHRGRRQNVSWTVKLQKNPKCNLEIARSTLPPILSLPVIDGVLHSVWSGRRATAYTLPETRTSAK